MRGTWYPFAYQNNVLTKEECEHLLETEEPWEEPTFGADHNYKIGHTSCRFQIVKDLWVFDRIIKAVELLNKRFLHFTWDNWIEDIQMSQYRGKAQHPWHIDWGKDAFYHRKINISLALDDQYTGGGLELNLGGEPIKVDLPVGCLVAFSSQFLHRVKPVDTGTRTALVTWGHGPCWT